MANGQQREFPHPSWYSCFLCTLIVLLLLFLFSFFSFSLNLWSPPFHNTPQRLHTAITTHTTHLSHTTAMHQVSHTPGSTQRNSTEEVGKFTDTSTPTPGHIYPSPQRELAEEHKWEMNTIDEYFYFHTRSCIPLISFKDEEVEVTSVSSLIHVLRMLATNDVWDGCPYFSSHTWMSLDHDERNI